MSDLNRVTYTYDTVPEEAWDILEQEWMYDKDIVSGYMENNHATIDVIEEDHVAMKVEWDEVRSAIDDSYQGRYCDDETFAQELAESMGSVPTTFTWPTSYIDWERAARDLMMDYYEVNGCYFRS